ncbi:murein transglycosylase domain-containing protein [uncultured Arcobacter sp.]|uniref:murein transglycosylase domain-containing protein n=1 Tax=uncultured Arcobacter sp. TaxID=165434 RepID=UPI00261284D5|nr:murein transglycosylase domain-containing protein [uncultured Arcobacter sp.]
MIRFALIFIVFFLTSCSVSDVQSVARAAISKDPSAVIKAMARDKTIQYTTNPKKLKNDIDSLDKFLSNFIKEISNIWGEKNVKIPKQKEYVKYMQNYKSRALVDFDKGIVTIETLDDKDYKKSLKNAIVTTLLLPDDPRAADLFEAKSVKLGATPYLLGEVKDDQNKEIRYEWRANRFADILLKKEIKTKSIKNAGKDVTVYSIDIPMVKDHANIRVAKFKPLVKRFAKKYNLSENLVYAIIQTESNFNQFAISSANAYGLMQIVPTSAGRDAYKYAKGRTWTPTKSYLFDAQNNIELGSAYLKILDSKYLDGIINPISKEYCIISAYNTGSGNVLKTFHKNRTSAKEIINEKNAQDVYEILINNLPYEETRNYLKKVIKYKKDFISI